MSLRHAILPHLARSPIGAEFAVPELRLHRQMRSRCAPLVPLAHCIGSIDEVGMAAAEAVRFPSTQRILVEVHT